MFPLPDAGPIEARPDRAKKVVSGVMLVLGIALLLFVPLGGALFLTAGGLGLVIASEPEDTTTRPQPSSASDR
jgi:hypothetical protein